jgi:hypothetical protein
MKMYELSSDGAYAIWSERSVIADCLKTMGLDIMAKKAIDPETPQEIINRFLLIIEKEAKVAQRHDVLDQLYFAGLIYG